MSVIYVQPEVTKDYYCLKYRPTKISPEREKEGAPVERLEKYLVHGVELYGVVFPAILEGKVEEIL